MSIAFGLNHVSVPARDLGASVAFYVDVLGLEPIPAPTFEVPVRWLRCGSLQVHLYQRDEPRDPSLYQHFGISVTDFMATYRRVREFAEREPVASFASVTELPDGSVQMYVRDPHGNLVELDHPDATTVDRAEVHEYRVLAEHVEQDGAARQSTLFLDRLG
jgi:catechol 2,3-dioxygenase-like lactoylglutathione lyase family enzyme